MKPSDSKPKQTRSFFARTGGALGLLLTLGLLLAASASATYESLATFGTEELPGKKGQQLEHPSGLAVNTSGAGGTPAGTVYAVFDSGSPEHPGVVRFSANGEFLDGWGPLQVARGIAVDQTTGNVYVLREVVAGKNAVQVYSPDGSQLITGFGERGAFEELIDEGPEKIHGTSMSGIAVDSSGVVYVSDEDRNGNFESRVMVFEPQSPGDYEHYVYAGREDDIAASHGSVDYAPAALALDSAGNLYITGEAAIYEFALSEPASPACEIPVPAGGTQGMTINPASGEVFYFSYKNKKVHQLAPCNAQGEFVETTSFAPTPTEEIMALTFNPTLAYEASRPPGILYGASNFRGYIFAPAEVKLPVVESESVASVTTSTATLGAQINPKGSQTSYVFQYITDAAYQANEPAERFAGAIEAPLGGAVLGSGQSPLGAAVSLVGLAPDTEYHYRAIATSHCDPEKKEEVCEDIGPTQAFHTFPLEAPELPDNRAWELVSPAQKQGGEVIPADPHTASCGSECKPQSFGGTFPMQSTPSGEAVVYEGFPFSATEGAARFNEYLAKRTGSGWQTTILSPKLQSSGNQGYQAFDAELTQGVLYQLSPTLSPEAPAGYANLYTQPTANPLALTPLLLAEPPNRPTGFLRLDYAGASADFSQLFFEANDALTGETPLAPAAVDPGPGTGTNHPKNLYESVNGQLQLVNVLPGNAETVPGAAFGSGKKLFGAGSSSTDFSHAVSDDGSRVFWSSEDGHLYVRVDGEKTLEIPSPGLCKENLPEAERVCFLTASTDGSKVLLSNGHLYDLEAEATVDLTEGNGGFQGIVGQSDELSHVYFVDTAVLTGEEENEYGAKAQVGENNLYAWDEGAVVFVATLLSRDNSIALAPLTGDWSPSPSQRTAEASPDGRWVAFTSNAPLTGYDNTGCGMKKSDLCSEVFLYDSTAGKLICPSCNPSGARPLGFSTLRVILGAQGSLPQPRYLLDSGRLYFDSQDSLSTFDTNNGVEDVYQYEPEGVGSCKREGGCVSLISAGHEPIDSNFLAIDSSGKNVFFTTRDQLVLKDRDDLIDLYVAREDGGIPAETETARSECQGESCQPAAVVPNDPTPGTSSLKGPGNLLERKAARKHRKHKHRHQAKKHRRKRAANHNRGGAK